MTNSIQNAALVLEATLELFVVVQQYGPHSPILGSPGYHNLNAAFSKDRFCNAIKDLRDQGNVLLLRQFFDSIFASLYGTLPTNYQYMNT